MLSTLRAPGVAYLLLSAVVARLPQAMSALAIVRLVRDQGGSYATAALLTAVFTVAGTFGQPFWGRLVDRTGRPRRVLLGSATLATAGLVGLALTPVDVVVAAVALAFVAGFGSPPVEPTLRSTWPRIMAPGRELQAAFSVDAAAQEVLFIAGPLATSLGILLVGAQGNVLAMGAIGLVGTALFARHRHLADRPPATGASHGRPLGSRPFRRLVLTMTLVSMPVGALTITASAMADLYGIGAFAAWALAINALGALAGAVAATRWPPTRPSYDVVWLLALGLAALYLPTTLVVAPAPVWLAASFVAGISFPPLLTQVFQQTEHSVDPAQLNEANAWIVSAFTVGIALGTLVAGLVADAVAGRAGVLTAVLVASAGAAIGALGARPGAIRSTASRVEGAREGPLG